MDDVNESDDSNGDVLALLVRRLYAAMIDMVLVAVGCYAVLQANSVLVPVLVPQARTPAAVLLGLMFVSEALTGRSVGKLAWRLAVSSEAGRATILQTALRTTARWIAPLISLSSVLTGDLSIAGLLVAGGMTLVICELPACYIAVLRRGGTIFDLIVHAGTVGMIRSMLACRRGRYRMSLICTALLLSIARPGMADPPVTAQAVDDCVTKAINYLYSLEQNGTWDPPAPDDSKGRYDANAAWGNWGGPTALITYALLAAGEDENDARLASAIKFLKTAKLRGTYSIGLRSEVWAHLPLNAETRTLIQRDAGLLYASMITQGACRGLWTYSNQGPSFIGFDFSNSQYGVLGLWGAADSGLEIPADTWKMMDQAWRRGQQPSGGWAYQRADTQTPGWGDPRFTMTAAGVATLFLTDDYLAPNAGVDCGENLKDADIERGLGWLGNNFDNLLHADKYFWGGFHYGLYGLERVGVASGHKYIGTTDWYQFGASELLKAQKPEGGWHTDAGVDMAKWTTAMSLLFLSYGRAPVAINKLEWDLRKTTTPQAANWNQRPRDAANLVRWIGRQTESAIKWQVVRLQDPVDELHDAPVLYLSGKQALDFSADDLAKLRQFVEDGGLILGNANCASREFATSFRKLGTKLFPLYEFRELPADHVIYTSEQYPRTKWPSKPAVLGSSNGARELMILLPTLDGSRYWQLQDYRSQPEAFQLLDDIILYASDKEILKPQRDSYLVAADPTVNPAQTVKIARIQYEGNWNPEPAGWRRLANIMHNAGKIELDVEPVKLGDGKLDPSAYPIAHLTGTAALLLKSAQQGELKNYIDAGGLLLIDAAGGQTAFAQSAETLIQKIAPAGAVLAPLDPSHPSMAGVKEPTLRKFAQVRFGKTKEQFPRGVEINGRAAVIYSPLDLSVALVGQPIDGIVGYEPDAAADIVSSVVAYAAHK